MIISETGIPRNLEVISLHVLTIPSRSMKQTGLLKASNASSLDFDVILYNLGNWIHVKALLLNTSLYPSQTVLSIYEIALGLNYDLPECTFSLFKNNLYIEIDCLIGIPFNDFKAEFVSIGNGIEAFINLIKNQKDEISIKSTKGLVKVKRQFE